MLSGCYADLPAEVQGRLIRPLSEQPEFWRAAPEEAQEWGAEELGFRSITPRAEALSPGLEEEGASSGTAAGGHLRTAGMQL